MAVFTFINYMEIAQEQQREIWLERNKDQIRMQMDNNEPFSFQSHMNFVKSLKNNVNKQYFGVYEDADFVASVNIVVMDEVTVEFGIFLSTKFLNRRYGSLIEQETEKLILNLGYENIVSRVIKSNARSINFFKKNNFELVGEDDIHFHFKKQIYE